MLLILSVWRVTVTPGYNCYYFKLTGKIRATNSKYNSTRPLKYSPLLPKVVVGKHKPQEKPCSSPQRNNQPSLKPYRINVKQRLKQDCMKTRMLVCEDSEEDGGHSSHWESGKPRICWIIAAFKDWFQCQYLPYYLWHVYRSDTADSFRVHLRFCPLFMVRTMHRYCPVLSVLYQTR